MLSQTYVSHAHRIIIIIHNKIKLQLFHLYITNAKIVTHFKVTKHTDTKVTDNTHFNVTHINVAGKDDTHRLFSLTRAINMPRHRHTHTHSRWNAHLDRKRERERERGIKST
jgi:hypothetical protein